MNTLTYKSLLLISPKQALFEAITPLLRSGETVESLYFPEENGAWIIQRVSSFESDVEFNEYIDRLKPKLMWTEIRRFIDEPEALTFAYTSESFDHLFEISIRDILSDILDL